MIFHKMSARTYHNYLYQNHCDIKQFLFQHFQKSSNYCYKKRIINNRFCVQETLSLRSRLPQTVLRVFNSDNNNYYSNNNDNDNNYYLYSIAQVSLLAGYLFFRKKASFTSNFNQMHLFMNSFDAVLSMHFFVKL